MVYPQFAAELPNNSLNTVFDMVVLLLPLLPNLPPSNDCNNNILQHSFVTLNTKKQVIMRAQQSSFEQAAKWQRETIQNLQFIRSNGKLFVPCPLKSFVPCAVFGG